MTNSFRLKRTPLHIAHRLMCALHVGTRCVRLDPSLGTFDDGTWPLRQSCPPPPTADDGRNGGSWNIDVPQACPFPRLDCCCCFPPMRHLPCPYEAFRSLENHPTSPPRPRLLPHPLRLSNFPPLGIRRCAYSHLVTG